MTGSNVEAPFRIGQTRDPYCVDKISGQGCGRDIFDSSRLLVDFESRGDNHKFLDGNWESDPAERPSFPIYRVPTIAVLLCVGPANPSVRYESELFPDREKLCADQIDIAVGCVLVLNRLDDERIIRAEHSTQGNGGQIFVAVVVRRQELCFEVEDIHSAEIEKWTDRRICRHPCDKLRVYPNSSQFPNPSSTPMLM